jgi:hypothetical protein
MPAKSFAPKKADKPNPFSVKKSDNGKPANPFSVKKHNVTRSGHDYADPTGLEISNLREIDGRYWAALVTYKGFQQEFHNRYGSWMSDVNEDNTQPIFSRDGMHGRGRMRDALPYVAALLSEKMPKPEPKEEEKPKGKAKPKKGKVVGWASLKKSKPESEKKSSSSSAPTSVKKPSASKKAAAGKKATGRAQRTRRRR